MILIKTDMPTIMLNEDTLLPFSVLSIETLSGTRWVTFVKLPDALLGGISENCDAVFEPIEKTLPVNVMPGKASMV